MKSFGQITWLVLADANRARKADRSGAAGGFHAETKSAGAQGVWTITGSVVTLPSSQCQPGITDGGAASKNTPRGTGYMDAAARQGGQRD